MDSILQTTVTEKILTLSQTINFKFFQIADIFKFHENGRKFFKLVENTGKRRNCSLRAISSFPTVFSKDLCCKQVKTGLVWERDNVPCMVLCLEKKER